MFLFLPILFFLFINSIESDYMYDDNDDNDEYFINSSQLDRQCQFTEECPINSTCNIHTNKCVCNFNHLWLNMDYSNKETEHMKSCEPFNCNDKPLLCEIFNSLKCNTTTGECVCLQNALEFDNFTQKCKLKPRDVIDSALRSETF